MFSPFTSPFIASVFTRLFQFLAVPVIAVSVITALSNISEEKNTGRIFKYTVFYTLLTTFLAAITGLILYLLFTPDKIIVSLGTNGCTAEDFNACAEAFFTALHKAYPGVPTLVINPLWRKDDGRLQIPKNNEAVISMCKPYPNIRFVDGFTLIPHVLEFFREDGLHPNVLGHKYYSDALVREIRRLRF